MGKGDSAYWRTSSRSPREKGKKVEKVWKPQLHWSLVFGLVMTERSNLLFGEIHSCIVQVAVGAWLYTVTDSTVP